MARPKKRDGIAIEWNEKGVCPVLMVEDVFAEENAAFCEALKAATGQEKPRVLVVADANVVQRTPELGTKIGKYFQTHGIALAGAPVLLAGGEKVKDDNLQSAITVVNAAIAAKVGARDVMLAIGGGAVLDVAGYAAAQVRGGVKLVRMPTTPGAMADAAFATNAALNFSGIKDSLRVPSRPAAVVIDTRFILTTLDGVWRGGIGEAVRYAAVGDGVLMRKIARNAAAIKSRDYEVTADVICDAVASRVSRGTTDFALWSATRLEPMSAYKLPHGYAVPIGICIDCEYAAQRGILAAEDRDLICGALTECGALESLMHSQHLVSQADNVLLGLDAMALSKGAETITLPSAVGKATTEEKPDRELYRKVLIAIVRRCAEQAAAANASAAGAGVKGAGTGAKGAQAPLNDERQPNALKPEPGTEGAKPAQEGADGGAEETPRAAEASEGEKGAEPAQAPLNDERQPDALKPEPGTLGTEGAKPAQEGAGEGAEEAPRAAEASEGEKGAQAPRNHARQPDALKPEPATAGAGAKPATEPASEAANGEAVGDGESGAGQSN